MTDLLHRQVPRALVQAGLVASEAFAPQSRENYELSVSQGKMVSARRTFEMHTAAGFKSAGVWSVSMSECETIGLPVRPDPVDQPYQNDAHAVIEFAHLQSRAQRRSAAQELARKANDRGCQYAAETPH